MSPSRARADWRSHALALVQRFAPLARDPRALRVAGELLLVPALVVFWGADLFGEWVVLCAVVGFLRLLEHVLPTPTADEIARGVAWDPARAPGRALGVALALGMLGLAYTAFVAGLLPLGMWLDLEQSGATGARLAAAGLGLSLSLAPLAGLLRTFLRRVGLSPVDRQIHALGALAWFAFPAFAAGFGGGPAVAAGAQLVPVLGLVIWDARALKRLGVLPRVSLCRTDLRESVELALQGLDGLALEGARTLSRVGLVLVVGAFSGPTAAGALVILRALAEPVRLLVVSQVRALRPGPGAIGNGALKVQIRSLHELSVKTLTILTLATSVLAFFLGPYALAVWTLGRVELDGWLYGALLASLVASTPWTVGVELLLFERQRIVARWLALASLAGLAAAAPLAAFFGPVGAVLALAGGELVLAAGPLTLEARRRTGARPFDPLPEALLATAVLAVTGTCAGWIVVAFLPWFAPLAGVVGASAVLVGAWKGWLDPREQERVSGFVRRALNRRARARERQEREEREAAEPQQRPRRAA